jgi:hypothetical protein
MIGTLADIAVAILLLWGACALLFLGALALDELRYRRWQRRTRSSSD